MEGTAPSASSRPATANASCVKLRRMPIANLGTIEIEYEILGEPDARPLLIIRGLGTQRIQWDPRFCEKLLEGGHRLVMFDNRDAGLSTHLRAAGRPDLAQVMQAVATGEPAPVPYTLDDMADDVVGLMDAIGIETAHVAGMSMGGMIAQTLAIRHGSRLRSLISVMSTTGNPEVPPPTPAALEALMSPAPNDRSAYIEHHIATSRVIGSPGYPTDEGERRDIAGRVFDRAFDPNGVARQFAAVQAHGNRRPRLASVTTPTLVIHGTDDPLVPVEGGRDTAAAIPGADLLEIPGMGHDLPPGLFDILADAITAHTRKSEAAQA